MAETDWGALAAHQKKVWASQAWKQARDNSFWFQSGFMGAGTSDTTKPIHYVKELTATERGDKCLMHLVPDMLEDGTVGDNILEGREEALSADDEEITLDQLRHAAKSRGQMSEQRTVIRFRETARDKLGNWWAQKIDELGFLTASGIAYTSNLDGSTRSPGSQLPSLAFAAGVTAPSTNRKVFAGGVASTASLTTAEKMTWNFVLSVAASARRKRVKPLNTKGKEAYILLMSTEQARDLKADSGYQTNVGRAQNRGNSNPLFTGYIADVDGILVYEHPKVYTTLGTATKWGAGTNVNGAQALLIGAQALGFARIGQPSWNESDNKDYGNRQGLSYGAMIGYKKPVFASIYDGGANEDFGIMSIYTAAGATV